MSEVERTGPTEVLGLDVGRPYLQLVTLVLQLSDVREIACEARSDGERPIVEQVLGCAHVVFEGYVQSVVEERYVESRVEIVVGFPRQLGILQLRQRDSGIVVVVAGDATQSLIAIIGRRQGAVNTIRQAQLQVVQPLFCGFHKFLGAYSPRARYRPEVAPAVFPGQARASIGSPTCTRIVFVVVIVVHTCYVRHDACGAAGSVHVLVHHAVVDFGLVGACEVGNGSAQSVRLLAVDFVSGQEVEVVLLVQRHLIGQDVRPRHVCDVVVVFAETSVVVIAVTGARVFPIARLVHHEVVAVGGCKLQVFPKVEGGVNGVERPGGILLLEVVGVRQHGVAVVELDELAVPRSVFVPNGV